MLVYLIAVVSYNSLLLPLHRVQGTASFGILRHFHHRIEPSSTSPPCGLCNDHQLYVSIVTFRHRNPILLIYFDHFSFSVRSTTPICHQPLSIPNSLHMFCFLIVFIQQLVVHVQIDSYTLSSFTSPSNCNTKSVHNSKNRHPLILTPVQWTSSCQRSNHECTV